MTGSSPRMRGTQKTSALDVRRPGLIPTYAGNTLWDGQEESRLLAHPHVCGEHQWRAANPRIVQGSSPRMRGTPSHPHCG